MAKWSDYTKQGSDYNRDRTVQDVPEETPVQEQQYPVEQEMPGYDLAGYPAPEQPQEEPYRIYDAHYSPQWVLDEKQNRLNPDYVSEITDDIMSKDEFDALANYVQGKKDANPQEWRYGDPGWSSDDVVWTDVFKPLEQNYHERQRAQQVVEDQKTELETATEAVQADKRFSKANVDTSQANYENLDNWTEKGINLFTPSAAGTDVTNAPEAAKYTQNILGSWMSSSGPARIIGYAAAAAGVPGVGWIVGISRALTFGYSYGKSVGAIKGNKTVDKIIELTDILDEKSQQFQGALNYGFEKAGGGDLSDGSKIGENIKFIADNLGEIMHYAFGSGKASTEYNPEVVGIVTAMTANMGGTTFIGNLPSRLVRSGISGLGGDFEYLNRDEVTRNNLAISGIQKIDEELMGSNATTFWLDYAQALYDQGLTDPTQLEYAVQNAITQYYGDLANFSEYFEHELTDPGNTAENMESRVMSAYGKATHDTNLVKAAEGQTHSLIGDLTGGIPVIPDVLREIGKLTGHPDFLKTSGGFNEVLAQWDIENITNDPSELTARDRRFSHISDDNTISRFNPTHTATTNVGRVVENIINFFRETDESRAMVEGDAIFDFISLGLEDAMTNRGDESPQATMDRMNKFLNELENPDTISENSPFYKNSQSVIFNSVKGDLAQAVRQHRAEINKMVQRYVNQDNNRKTLNSIALALNLQPQKVLDMYQNDQAVLTQMILNKAKESGGMLPGIDVPVEDPKFGTEVIGRLKPFTGNDADAWDMRQLGLQMSTEIADGVSDVIINKYGIKPDKFIYRFGDTIKKMQNLLLLGLSPSYLANNLVNNVVTRTSLGYGGWMSMQTIGSWMERFGYKPERFADSIAGEIGQESTNKKTNYDNLQMKISDKKKMKDGLDKINDFSSKASKKFGLFGNVSGKIESMESQQIIASAMMNYMSKTWKAGVNFRKMPAYLEAAIEQQNPGMVKAIYAAVESGINMSEIEQALFGTYIAPSVEDSLRTAAKRRGISDDIVTEYFVRSGLVDQLKEAVKGRRGDEIDDIVRGLGDRLNQYMSIQLAEDISKRAEAIANMTANEGFVTALEVAYDDADEMLDVWLTSQDLNNRIFRRRTEENIKTKEFRAMYQEHQKRLTERWKNVRAESLQRYSGILKGLGFSDKNSKTYLEALRKKNHIWDKFYSETQPKLIQPYLKALEWRNGDTFEKWDSRAQKAYTRYKKSVKAAAERTQKREAELQKRMDEAYVAGLKEAVGTLRAADVDAKIVPILEAIRAKRQEIIDYTNSIRAVADEKILLNEKNEAWAGKKEGKLKDLKTQQADLQKQLYSTIADFNLFATNKPGTDPTEEVDHSANILADIEEAKADSQKEVAGRYSEKMSGVMIVDPNGVARLSYVDATPDGWRAQLIRENLREMAERTGAGEEASVAFESLVSAVADRYEKNNKSKDFFKDKLGISVEYLDEDRTTTEIQGTDGQLYQVEKISKADINTPEFKAWHGDNPENFVDGKPLTVWHGSSAWFPNFRKDLLGSFTHAPSAKMGFFFAGKKLTSESYTNQRDSYHGYKTKLYALLRGESRKRQEIFDKARDEYKNLADKSSIPDFGDIYYDIHKEFVDVAEEVLKEFAEYGSAYNTDIKRGLYKIIDAMVNANAEDEDDLADQYGRFAVARFEIESMHKALENKEQTRRKIESIPNMKTAEEYIHKKLNIDENELEELFAKQSEILGDYSPDRPEIYENAVSYAQNIIRKAKRLEETIQSEFHENDSTLHETLDSVESQLRNLPEYPHPTDQYDLLVYARVLGEICASVESLVSGAEKENIDRILYSPENPNLREFYLSFNNPYIVDYERRNRADVIRYSQAVRRAIDGGYDAVILKNTYDGGPWDNFDTIYVVFEPNQMKSVYNSGEWSDPNNIYHQEAEQKIKGQFKIEDGKKLISLFRGSDMSSLIHETIHGFSATLNDTQASDLAQYFGVTLEEYRRLENLFYADPDSMTETERTSWVDMQEKFAYGFEQYLMEGIAPNEGMRQVFAALKAFLVEVYKGVKKLVYKGEKIDIHKEQNGKTLAEIFDSFLTEDVEEETAPTGFQLTPEQVEAQKAKSQQNLADGKYAPLGDVDLSKIKPSAERDAEIMKYAKELYDKFKDDVYPEDTTAPGNTFAPPTLQDWIAYIYKSVGEDGQPLLSSTKEQLMDFRISTLDDKSISEHVEALRSGRISNDIPKEGVYVGRCYSFDHGGYQITAKVYQDGKEVAYVPAAMDTWQIDDDGETYRILGVSPDDPSLYVYVVGNEIRTEKRRDPSDKNPHSPEMQQGSMPELDPTARAHNKVAFEQVYPVLEEFINIYKQNLDNNMTSQKWGSLNEKTRSALRQYVDTDVRTDLMNTKYKTGKFGEMVRDAALLNYSKRYGFDNFFTLICPYQFWQTRSMMNWINRMGTKGGKLWRKYYKLKELEKRNKKEFMPSRITGKFGLYIPGLPDWMGDAIFMSTDQLFVVNQFMDPILNYGKNKNATIAAAEKYVLEDYQEGKISYPEYLLAMNEEKRDQNSGIWQEALAKAQLENDDDSGLGGLVGNYLGFSLPVSIGKALLTNKPGQWSQFPMSKTGTAFRAVVGDNWVGKMGEAVLSAPERALRKAAVSTFGNAFAYNEFGAFGDYYLRNQIFDMVTEGRISPTDAVQACVEKDGNPIWEEAADRQREETLVKMQGGSVLHSVKKLISDIKDGKQDEVGGDWQYVLASFLTAPMQKNVVHEAEKTWRKEGGELSKAIEAKEAGDKDAVNKFYDEHPTYSYKNLRYEDDPEQMLRQFLYKSITEKYYDLDKAERRQIDMSFGPDFQKYVISKETRAIETMDLNKLSAYAQALNGKIPYLATDKINTRNAQPVQIAPVPKTTLQQYNDYLKERDRLFPGMSNINSIYYNLPAQDRAILSRAVPNLAKYQTWDKQYKTQHSEVKQYSGLLSDMYDIREAEEACALFDELTMRELTYAAHTNKDPDAIYKPLIQAVMQRVGTTDSYENFVKSIKKYILSE